MRLNYCKSNMSLLFLRKLRYSERTITAYTSNKLRIPISYNTPIEIFKKQQKAS